MNKKEFVNIDDMTTFKLLGHTPTTKFVACRNLGAVKKGDIVTLCEDLGGDEVRVIRKDLFTSKAYIPGMAPEDYGEDLEVLSDRIERLECKVNALDHEIVYLRRYNNDMRLTERLKERDELFSELRDLAKEI